MVLGLYSEIFQLDKENIYNKGNINLYILFYFIFKGLEFIEEKNSNL